MAGVILALSGAAIGTSVRGALETTRRARNYQQAGELLDRMLTKIDLIGPERIMLEGPTEGEFEPPDDRFRWETAVESHDEGYLYKVTVRIIWETPEAERSVEGQTLLNDPPNSHSPLLHWDAL